MAKRKANVEVKGGKGKAGAKTVAAGAKRRELTRDELEALRRKLQAKFH